jgi:hypothetical protein
LAFKALSLSAKETLVWSYPSLVCSRKKGLLKGTRKSIKEDCYLLCDGERIVVLLGKSYEDGRDEREGWIQESIKEARYLGGIYQAEVVVEDKSAVNCM